jgi:hypothetical protein
VKPNPFDPYCWSFLVFDEEANDRLKKLIFDLTPQVSLPLRIKVADLPEDWVSGMRPCRLYALDKRKFPQELLFPLLRKHLGSDVPDASCDVYTLGIDEVEAQIIDEVLSET